MGRKGGTYNDSRPIEQMRKRIGWSGRGALLWRLLAGVASLVRFLSLTHQCGFPPPGKNEYQGRNRKVVNEQRELAQHRRHVASDASSSVGFFHGIASLSCLLGGNAAGPPRETLSPNCDPARSCDSACSPCLI